MEQDRDAEAKNKRTEYTNVVKHFKQCQGKTHIHYIKELDAKKSIYA